MTQTYQGITYVIPCGGAKLDHAAPAAQLYTGSMFRHTLEKVTRCAELDDAAGLGPARVLILSARHGLVQLGDVLEPYDVKMADAGSVTADQLADQARAFGIDWDGGTVYAFLPRPYLARLDAALRTLDVYVQDVYEGCGGILQQKRVNVSVAREDVAPERVTLAGVDQVPCDGLHVWIGGDVQALWWGVPVLVSYGRLRDAAELPAASAPWVLDSRGFTELNQHGTWTIDAARYAADVRRYVQEIGHLRWVAPQDWPAAPALLERTGLTEEEHQRRTVASVVELRAMLPGVHVLAVLTGATRAGYLRHIEMYRAAGIDVTTELVGIGALVGRDSAEIADIVRALHAAGVTTMHGFGVKGRPLDLVGPLLESIDSVAWSAGARHREGHCPHGLVKWERNCPHAALTWAADQRRRSLAATVQTHLFAYSA